jgi:hypothetical protein
VSLKFDVERFNPKQLNEVEVREKEGLKIRILENRDDISDVNAACENITKNIRISSSRV